MKFASVQSNYYILWGLRGGLSLEKFGFSDAGQFCDSVCFEYMNILALKYFLFEIERTFGSEVMVNLLKGVS